ncbi:orotate phosphoribosyltransferase [Candidatus Woesearchaeota archaeon]|nr:orotate phosphoribosyltransferase [Candidatus Woesearchaeota archaeon]
MNPGDVAKLLLDIKAVTLNFEKPYKWVSGILAPIYCDNRKIIFHPEAREKIKEGFTKIIEENNIEYDVIAGVATGAIAHAAFIAKHLNKPMIYIRGRAKEHGKQNQIEGASAEELKGKKVLVVEDLISTGGSSVSAVEAVRETGAVVVGCIAVFTYEMEKARKRFEEADCNLITLSNFSTLVDVAADKGYLKPEEKEKVLEFSKDLAGWGKKMGFE